MIKALQNHAFVTTINLMLLEFSSVPRPPSSYSLILLLYWCRYMDVDSLRRIENDALGSAISLLICKNSLLGTRVFKVTIEVDMAETPQLDLRITPAYFF